MTSVQKYLRSVRKETEGKEEIIKRAKEKGEGRRAEEEKTAVTEKKAAAAGAEKKAAAAAKKKVAAEKTAATAVMKQINAHKGASDVTENVETPAESEETRKRPMNSYILRAKRTRYDVVDSDAPSCSSVTTSGNTSTSTTMWQCSICYEDYDAVGTEDWVQCGCGRWNMNYA